MSEAMKQEFGLIKRPWGVYYLKNKTTGEQTSLKTRDWPEAQRLLQAHNETKSQPHFNLALARVYINGADPKLATRTWQEVMEHIVAKKTDETRRRWEVAILDKNFDYIRNLPVAETRPEHFDRALADGKVSTNVYLRRIHNHALGMEWLLKSVIPRLQWPRPVFKAKRAITSAEHAAVIARELNPERRDFYELLWHTGASQTDAACLTAEDVNWNTNTIATMAATSSCNRDLSPPPRMNLATKSVARRVASPNGTPRRRKSLVFILWKILVLIRKEREPDDGLAPLCGFIRSGTASTPRRRGRCG
jgi:hypothetical protein